MNVRGTMLLCAGLLGAGCGREENPVRRYEETVIPAPPPRRPPSAMANAMAPPGEEAAVRWTTPAGWRESTGSGMRLASFAVGPEERPADGSIVMFPGDVGGVEANLRRWLDQVGVTLSGEAFRRFMNDRETFFTAGGLAGQYFDFTAVTGGAETSMLASVVQRGDFQVFVKLMGPADVVRAEREPFRTLSQSLQ